jgi:DNA gyrase subunit A
MATIRSGDEKSFVLTATDGGFGKRTDISEYRLQSRGGIGVKAAKVDEGARGGLVGALIVNESNEILVITSGGVVMRTPVKEVRQTGRDTLGVRLVNLDQGTFVVSLAKVNDED